MCNSWVKRLIKWDKQKLFHFAPLESDTAEKLLKPLMPGYLEEDTIIYYDNGKILLRSDAALSIIGQLRPAFDIINMGKLVPKSIRDRVYRWVAARRYKYGDRYTSCPLPLPEWRDRFLN